MERAKNLIKETYRRNARQRKRRGVRIGMMVSDSLEDWEKISGLGEDGACGLLSDQEIDDMYKKIVMNDGSFSYKDVPQDIRENLASLKKQCGEEKKTEHSSLVQNFKRFSILAISGV